MNSYNALDGYLKIDLPIKEVIELNNDLCDLIMNVQLSDDEIIDLNIHHLYTMMEIEDVLSDYDLTSIFELGLNSVMPKNPYLFYEYSNEFYENCSADEIRQKLKFLTVDEVYDFLLSNDEKISYKISEIIKLAGENKEIEKMILVFISDEKVKEFMIKKIRKQI